ncbi:cation:proton antiporter [Rhodococcoides kroppenstedtii]|uniref:cation:proton antiporter domain-containing protein n=1 Tax=Rhodococcoides kroppenstedtii TaxID=293050 RepID=UPI00353048ED
MWALVQRKLRSIAISGPLAMAVVGALFAYFVLGDSTGVLDSELALKVAELILALLLFVDAVDVRGSLVSQAETVPMRLLFLALPLSLVLVLAMGLLLPLGLSVAALLAIACIVIPADFSPEFSIVRDVRIPSRLRRWLSIESGYNDGFVTPLLLTSLALASTQSSSEDDAVAVFLDTAPAGLLAIAVGVCAGSAAGWSFRWAISKKWADVQSARIGVLALPFVTFALAVGAGGNGFVAAFVCGIAFRTSRGGRQTNQDELALAEDLALLANLLMWLAFGMATAIILTSTEKLWPSVVLAVFALTVGRFVPVLISLIGAPVSLRDRAFLAMMGPRGAASIVFGLIAFNALPPDEGFAVLAATCVVVAGSLVLHGVGGPVVAKRMFSSATLETSHPPSSDDITTGQDVLPPTRPSDNLSVGEPFSTGHNRKKFYRSD